MQGRANMMRVVLYTSVLHGGWNVAAVRTVPVDHLQLVQGLVTLNKHIHKVIPQSQWGQTYVPSPIFFQHVQRDLTVTTYVHTNKHTHKLYANTHTHTCAHTYIDVMSSNDTTHSGKFSSLQDGRHLYHSSGKPIIHVMHSTPYQKLLQRHLRKTVQYILVLGKSNTRSTPSLWSLPRVAFETVSGFWCHKHPMTNLMVPEYAGMAGCTSQKSNYIIFPLHYRRVIWIGLL